MPTGTEEVTVLLIRHPPEVINRARRRRQSAAFQGPRHQPGSHPAPARGGGRRRTSCPAPAPAPAPARRQLGLRAVFWSAVQSPVLVFCAAAQSPAPDEPCGSVYHRRPSPPAAAVKCCRPVVAKPVLEDAADVWVLEDEVAVRNAVRVDGRSEDDHSRVSRQKVPAPSERRKHQQREPAQRSVQRLLHRITRLTDRIEEGVVRTVTGQQ